MRRLGVRGVVAAVAVAVAAASCEAPAFDRPPPAPSIPPADLGPDAPPVVWVGGTVVSLTPTVLELQEAVGPVVAVQRLGANATRFFRISGDAWEAFSPGEQDITDADVCVEALLDDGTFLALRVFVDVACGPS